MVQSMSFLDQIDTFLVQAACVRHLWWRTEQSWPLFSPTFFFSFLFSFYVFCFSPTSAILPKVKSRGGKSCQTCKPSWQKILRILRSHRKYFQKCTRNCCRNDFWPTFSVIIQLTLIFCEFSQ